MWRSLFLAIGIFTILLGIGFLGIDRVTMRFHDEAPAASPFDWGDARERGAGDANCARPLVAMELPLLWGGRLPLFVHHPLRVQGEVKAVPSWWNVGIEQHRRSSRICPGRRHGVTAFGGAWRFSLAQAFMPGAKRLPKTPSRIPRSAAVGGGSGNAALRSRGD